MNFEFLLQNIAYMYCNTFTLFAQVYRKFLSILENGNLCRICAKEVQDGA